MPVTDFILVVYLLVPPACYFNKTRTPCQIIYKVYSMITSPDNYFVEHIFQWLLLVSKKNKFAKVGQSVYLKWHFIFLLIWNTELGLKIWFSFLYWKTKNQICLNKYLMKLVTILLMKLVTILLTQSQSISLKEWNSFKGTLMQIWKSAYIFQIT